MEVNYKWMLCMQGERPEDSEPIVLRLDQIKMLLFRDFSSACAVAAVACALELCLRRKGQRSQGKAKKSRSKKSKKSKVSGRKSKKLNALKVRGETSRKESVIAWHSM